MSKRGIIFDLDGTLVDSQLDFVSMRADLAIPDGADILTWIASAEPPEQERLHAIVHHY